MTSKHHLQSLKQQLESVIVGQHELIERMIIALLAGGHMLLEGPPGLAKSTAVHALAKGILAQFHRIQFTPDLMPSDLTGSDIFDPSNGSLSFSPGPIFNQIVLADELNRAPPKVQSALLEAMAEQHVSVGHHTHKLDDFFFVLATQNPLEQFGTYALPEALLDRFIFKFIIDYPTQQQEVEIARRSRQDDSGHLESHVEAILTTDDILALRQQVNNIHIEPNLEEFAVKLVASTRKLKQLDNDWGDYVKHGASPRASIALLRSAMAKAFFQQRDYVIPEDIIELAPDVLRHRLVLDFSAEAQGKSADDIIQYIINLIEAP